MVRRNPFKGTLASAFSDHSKIFYAESKRSKVNAERFCANSIYLFVHCKIGG